ncbi:hypothetical protein IWQ56_006241, partial [Coemansia nantahalensis]
MAFADDLTLMAPSREALQATATDVARWCRLVGITANPHKTAHVSVRGPQGDAAAAEIVWGEGEAAAPIRNVWPAAQPLRVLGNYLTPDGTAAGMLSLAHERVDSLLRIARCRQMTDRMG